MTEIPEILVNTVLQGNHSADMTKTDIFPVTEETVQQGLTVTVVAVAAAEAAETAFVIVTVLQVAVAEQAVVQAAAEKGELQAVVLLEYGHINAQISFSEV